MIRNQHCSPSPRQMHAEETGPAMIPWARNCSVESELIDGNVPEFLLPQKGSAQPPETQLWVLRCADAHTASVRKDVLLNL